jgi:hypothetical protein
MYTHVHSVAGTAIVGATYLVTKDTVLSLSVGGALAFISHHYIDKLGEYSLTSSDKYMAESVVMLNLLGASYVLGDLFWIPLAGIFFGNLMDLIDKKLGLVFFRLDIVDFLYKRGCAKSAEWCTNNLNVTRHFKCHRLKQYKYLTYSQTMSFAFVSMMVSILFHFILLLNN